MRGGERDREGGGKDGEVREGGSDPKTTFTQKDQVLNPDLIGLSLDLNPEHRLANQPISNLDRVWIRLLRAILILQ